MHLPNQTKHSSTVTIICNIKGLVMDGICMLVPVYLFQSVNWIQVKGGVGKIAPSMLIISAAK